MTYKEYLKSIGVLSEEDFNEIVATLPDVIVNANSYEFSDTLTTKEGFAIEYATAILATFTDFAYVIKCDLKKRELEIEDVSSLQELEKIKKIFSGWTIIGYDDIKESFEQNEAEKESLLNFISNNASVKQLQDFANSL